ncbi:hypothetical protein JCGZ_25677 [Jatropha curcas]|uniref:Aminotransferase-like plant mobile domain-containing protein n=1 Tax=Jatropha curcas TaxID=180498 RepID=A0A067LIF3_JATCU|nr:hypothetical protein JCGZ_25677 [Jatropha curcas]
MTSPGHSSDDDFLGSLGISLDTDLTADADTHASVTGIYAQDPHIRLDVGETSVAEIPVEIFGHNSLVGAIISPSHLDYMRHFDIGWSSHKELMGALAERWWDTTNTFHFSWGELTMNPTYFSVISRIPFGTRAIELYDDWRTEISPDRMVELIGIDLPRIVGPSSSTPVLSTWAFEYFPYTRPELIHADLGLGLVPSAWRCISYHTPDGTLAFREVSLENVDRLDLPSEDINEDSEEEGYDRSLFFHSG